MPELAGPVSLTAGVQSPIDSAAPLGPQCGRVGGLTGVRRTRHDRTRVKLASISVHARNWVTWHGVALNVENDLTTFVHNRAPRHRRGDHVHRGAGVSGGKAPDPGLDRGGVEKVRCLNAADVFVLTVAQLPGGIRDLLASPA